MGILEQEFMSLPNRANLGFTLLELLVTTGLSLFLLGGAIASFNSFSTEQDKVQSAKDVQTVLQRAQVRSRNGDKPDTGCTQLNGYGVRAAAGSNTYDLVTRCDGQIIETQTFNLRQGQYFDQAFDVTYPVFPGPISGAPVIVQIGELSSGQRQVYRFTILQSGVTSKGGVITVTGNTVVNPTPYSQ